MTLVQPVTASKSDSFAFTGITGRGGFVTIFLVLFQCLLIRFFSKSYSRPLQEGRTDRTGSFWTFPNCAKARPVARKASGQASIPVKENLPGLHLLTAQRPPKRTRRAPI